MNFVRYESTEVDLALGVEIGVFGLLNRLSQRGLLTEQQEAIRRERYTWFEAAYLDPASVDPTVYDRGINPSTKAWFKAAAARHLIAELDVVLELLDAHRIEHRRVTSDALPGRLVYEDAVQVVVVQPA